MKNKPGRPKSDKLPKIINLWEQGYSDEEIAQALGITEGAVRGYRYKNGMPNGYAITKHWLEESGIGDKWDKTCKRIRKAAGL